jgi:predicted AAA+ superfamily ATPase
MLTTLERLIGEVGNLSSKLILLVGPSRSGKTQLLRQLGAKLNIEPLNVGLELGRCLASTPNNMRSFLVSELLREIAGKERSEDLLLLDNLGES